KGYALVLVDERQPGKSPVVPDGDDPSDRPQYPRDLAARAFDVEPVEGLARGDEVNASAVERRRLCAPLDALEVFVIGEQTLARLAHLAVRLDAVDAVAVSQEQLRQNARPRTHVGDDRRVAQSALAFEQFDDRPRIARPVLDVVLDATRKTACGV